MLLHLCSGGSLGQLATGLGPVPHRIRRSPERRIVTCSGKRANLGRFAALYEASPERPSALPAVSAVPQNVGRALLRESNASFNQSQSYPGAHGP